MTRSSAPTPQADPLPVHPAFFAGSDAVVLAAPAKLNLFLEILRKRPDGYHDLESLMVAVSLFDTLEMRAAPNGEITLTCDPATLSTGPDNLVHKAAAALRTRANRPDLGAVIHLTKRIPTQAGLGGGSSDAAAAIVGLNQIWKLALTREELVAIAAFIGSDVAFFLSLPAAWCTGRGEITTPEPVDRGAGVGPYFVLVFPPVGISTVGVYRRLTVPQEPVSGGRVRAAFRARDAAALGAAMFNRLEEPAFAIEPVVGRIRERLGRLNPAGAMMSGSGSTVFAPCRDAREAHSVAAAFTDSRPADEPESRVLVVHGFTP
ncbi:4-diphosphocytidyl-2-C-methyl-D-erythritol kinase [Gemmata sp. SH-PL17]|uniref:4-(cytidine 5'-diphospho)-2-C-methyl-D-erythritol kinase n=1 Tax=Gemmata sp. SH-PL17 TaxID=1630693 RepID=UPI00078D5834|nr:4-(cytidine 5'-diphospho)-2-C-methyl-D-erythritol kinase [Gemmata sp. SH-PL17]AMV23548.1 4-diphosphocytidyl-2-C-methyl-D-erythritol kinase [Gemmata sp. SH-PL17]